MSEWTAQRVLSAWSRPRFWIWSAIMLASLLCVLIAILHYVQSRSMKESFAALERTRQARLDLANGFLHVLMSKEPDTPFDRSHGLVLLRQGVDALDGMESQGKTATSSYLVEFKNSIDSWFASGGRNAGDEALLRSSFHRLEMQSEALDRKIRASIAERSARHDKIFLLALWGAALALLGICATIYKLWQEQILAECRLKDSEARFRHVLETSADAVFRWRVGSGTFDYISPSAQNVLGRSPSILTEMNRAGLSSIIDPEDLPKIVDAILGLLKGREIVCDIEFRVVRPDGVRRWVAGAAKAVPNDTGSACCIVGSLRDVDARHKAEEALHGNEEKFRLLVESLPQMLFIKDRSEAYVFCNDKFANHIGKPTKEILSHKDSEILPQKVIEHYTIHDRMVMQTGRSLDEEEESFLKPGIWLRSLKIPLRKDTGEITGMIGMFWDITTRKAAEMALERERSFTKAVMDSVPGLLFLYDENLKLTRWNARHLEITGYNAEELEEKDVFDWCGGRPESIAKMREAVKKAVADGHVEFKLDIVTKEGKTIPLYISAITVELDGKRYFTGIGLDVSGQQKTMEQLAQANAELGRAIEQRNAELAVAKERAELMDKLKASFIAAFSNELKLPMNSILNFTGLMLQGQSGPLLDEQRKQLEIVRARAKRMLTTITDVQQLAKLDASQLEIRKNPLDLRVLAEEAITNAEPAATRKALSLRLEQDGWDGIVISDHAKIKLILDKLLDNAIKFTDSGNISLRISEDTDGRIHLRVSDTGTGIMESNIPKLFQPFRQLENEIARRNDGAGLGLALCRSLAKALGGEISVRSEWGKGSSFTLSLPSGRAP